MFDMIDLFVTLHPHILRALCTCLYPDILITSWSCALSCILESWHPHSISFMCPCLHPWLLTSSASCVLVCNLASSLPLILRLMYSVCLLVSSHPHILIFSGSSVHTCLGNWNQIKNNGSNHKMTNRETNNGSKNIFTK